MPRLEDPESGMFLGKGPDPVVMGRDRDELTEISRSDFFVMVRFRSQRRSSDVKALKICQVPGRSKGKASGRRLGWWARPKCFLREEGLFKVFRN